MYAVNKTTKLISRIRTNVLQHKIANISGTNKFLRPIFNQFNTYMYNKIVDKATCLKCNRCDQSDRVKLCSPRYNNTGV